MDVVATRIRRLPVVRRGAEGGRARLADGRVPDVVVMVGGSLAPVVDGSGPHVKGRAGGLRTDPPLGGTGGLSAGRLPCDALGLGDQSGELGDVLVLRQQL